MIDSLHSALLASLHKPLRRDLATLHDLPSPNLRCCSSAIIPLAQPCSLLQPLCCIIRAHPGPQCMSGQLFRRQSTIQLEGTASACLLGTSAAVSRIRSSSPLCGGCRHPKVHAIICLRHGYAVHKIALAIKQGAMGDAYLFMDAEGHQRFPRNADNVPALPPWVCPSTHSKPDVVFFPSISTCISQDDLQTWGPAERSHHFVILLEVSFTSDTNLHHRAVDKCEQHSLLRQALLESGWKTVIVLPLIIGHGGEGFCSGQHREL